MSIQRQWTGMLALSAQILCLVRVSRDKAPDGQISECTLRLGRPDGYLQIRSPKLKSFTIPVHCVWIDTPHDYV